jgi:NAD(P)-dependent dehydrogenase (short-subunit alcohol dehydrogenase family)
MASIRPVFVVAGVGNGTGTGASSARVFAKAGYSVAILARGADSVKKLADEITAEGGEALPFPIASYGSKDISEAFKSIDIQFPSNTHSIRVALFNASVFIWKPFLEITPEEVQLSLDTNITAAFAFSKEVILRYKQNDIVDGKRGSLIFTGATASLRGAINTAAFSTAKTGVRTLSQSLAKEFGPANIHVSHAIIDGGILTDNQRARMGPTWASNEDVRLDPDSIATSYLYLVNQHRSAWTWELDQFVLRTRSGKGTRNMQLNYLCIEMNSVSTTFWDI